MKPTYPNVRCRSGHPDQPGYVVCRHVLRGERVEHFERAQPDRLGVATCSDCHAAQLRTHKSAGRLILSCAQCTGFLPAVQRANAVQSQPTLDVTEERLTQNNKPEEP